MSCFNGILKVLNLMIKLLNALINSKPFFKGLEINGAISLMTFNLMLVFFIFMNLMGQFTLLSKCINILFDHLLQ